MIKNKYIEFLIKNKKQLKSLNNDNFKVGDYVKIKTKDLPKGTHLKIIVICNKCGIEKEIQFNNYYRITNGLKNKYYCNNTECINEKRKISIQKKYGVDNIFQLEIIKEKIKKTNLEKYGFENPQQNKIIKDKSKKTNLEKYGFENVFQSIVVKEKIKKTNLEKYGVEYPQQSEYIRSKYGSLHKPSKIEKQLFNFIKENYNGEILCNKNDIINGYELDIYLPDLKLAFEFNGLYWHNELYKDKNYHNKKTNLCFKKDIQLIHIWEDDWDYKQDIIKSMILNKLNKTPNKVFARKCKVKEINDNSIIRDFLDKNHIQGFVGSKYKFGLFYDNQLVSVMIFGKNRKMMNIESKNKQYEMLRFCNKLNTNILGGASKLFKYFINKYKPEQVISYADRSYSNGNLYKILGFKLKHISKPNYYYIINKKRKHRFGFRKDVLIKDGFDPKKSEHEIMLERKIYRIYNSGNYVYLY